MKQPAEKIMSDQNNTHTIERLFDKVDTIIASINCTNNSVSILSTKIDEFSHRLRKLEDREEQQGEKQHKLELIASKLENVTTGGLETIHDLEKRMTTVETDVTKIKTNWGWVVALVGAAGGALAWLISTGISIWLKIH